MKVFVTGATGFVGSAVVQELLSAGHEVVGLARNDANAAKLTAAGAQVHRGELQDLESLKSAAAESDGVIHCGFVHDFSRFQEVCEIDRQAIAAIGSVLVGSDRPFVNTSGTALVSPGQLATEDTVRTLSPSDFPRVASEMAMEEFAEQRVRAMNIRLSPSVHGDGDHGFIPMLINLAREKGESAYVGEGLNRWNAVHRLDAAVLYRLAIEKGSAGAKYHAVGDEGIAFRDIAAAIGRGLGVPVVSKTLEEAAAHFDWIARFAGLDCPASSKLTQERLGWTPTHCGLLADLTDGTYFGA